MKRENDEGYELCESEEHVRKSSQERKAWYIEVNREREDLTRNIQHFTADEGLASDATKVPNLALHEANAKASAFDAKLQVMSNENLRLIEERGKLKRQTERLEDTIQSIIRAIAQEVPVEEGLSKKLINSPREDSEALIKDMQEALHVYIEHCEHQVSFPLKSALFSVRSELADTQASLWTMQHKLTKEVAGAEEQCLRSAQSAVDQSFYEINRDIEKMYKEVEALRLQYTNEVAEIKQEYRKTICCQNNESSFRISKSPCRNTGRPGEQGVHIVSNQKVWADEETSMLKPQEGIFTSSPRRTTDQSLAQRRMLGRPHFSVPSQYISAMSQQSDKQEDEDISSTLERIEAMQLQRVE